MKTLKSIEEKYIKENINVYEQIHESHSNDQTEWKVHSSLAI